MRKTMFLLATMSLERWAERRVKDLGIDAVFAPYLCGMLELDLTDEENRENIMEVIMGWLPEDQKEDSLNFVDELIAFSKNRNLLVNLEEEIDKTTTSTTHISHNALPLVAHPNPENEASSYFVTPTKELHSGTSLWSFETNNRTTSTGVSTIHQEAIRPELSANAAAFIPTTVYGSSTLENETHECDHSDEQDKLLSFGEHDEDPFIWELTCELVEYLMLSFPDCDPKSLLEILRVSMLDVDQAAGVVHRLLEREQKGMTQVCRHYLQGECRRADCMFLHDTHTITCRFWLHGTCAQEEQCIFYHGYIPTSEKLSVVDSDSESEGIDHMPDFNNEEKFPSLSSLNIKKEEENSGRYLDFARAVNLSSSEVQSHRTKPSLSSSHSWSMSRIGSKHLTKWVTTGDTVSSQYRNLREQAGKYARARNQCFMNATKAYCGGDKAKAKSLSQQGREYNDRMKECHLEAATELFKSRNPPSQIYDEKLLDLHGLHVAEAVELLLDMLPRLSDEGISEVRIVTGSGHHSSGSHRKARLKPAVERMLRTEGYHYSEVADRKGFVGMLLVNLTW